MQSKNYPPLKKHSDFQKWIRENYPKCQNCYAPATDGHHILGAAGKENKIWVGQWAFTMLCYECNHDDQRLPPKQEQLINFIRGPVQDYWKTFRELPMSADELMAIACWSR